MMEVTTSLKRCSKCGRTQPTTGFTIDRRRPDGLKTWCRDCANSASARYFATPQGRRARRETQTRHRHGITLADYASMLARQAGRCAICQQSFATLDIDHDATRSCTDGREWVRGLLCGLTGNGCNQGHFREDVQLCQRWIAYLEADRGRDVDIVDELRALAPLT